MTRPVFTPMLSEAIFASALLSICNAQLDGFMNDQFGYFAFANIGGDKGKKISIFMAPSMSVTSILRADKVPFSPMPVARHKSTFKSLPCTEQALRNMLIIFQSKIHDN